jgi:hypothetical protein
MRYVHIENGIREVREFPTFAEKDDLLAHMNALVGADLALEALQYVEGERPGTKLCALCNEDGRRLTLPFNVDSIMGPVVGPIIVIGIDEEGETRDLTDDEIARVSVRQAARRPSLFIAPHSLRVLSR